MEFRALVSKAPHLTIPRQRTLVYGGKLLFSTAAAKISKVISQKRHDEFSVLNDGNYVSARSRSVLLHSHFLDHVSNVYSTCPRMLGILRRLDGNISPLCMERIYKTAIRSRMEYSCAVWSGGSTRSLQRLQDSFAKRLGLTLPH